MKCLRVLVIIGIVMSACILSDLFVLGDISSTIVNLLSYFVLWLTVPVSTICELRRTVPKGSQSIARYRSNRICDRR